MKFETHRARVIAFCETAVTKRMRVGESKDALLQLSSLRCGEYTWEVGEKLFRCTVSIPEWATRANEHVQGRRSILVERLG